MNKITFKEQDKNEKLLFITNIETEQDMMHLFNYCQDNNIEVSEACKRILSDNINNCYVYICYFDEKSQKLRATTNDAAYNPKKYGDQKMTLNEFIKAYKAFKIGDYIEIKE